MKSLQPFYFFIVYSLLSVIAITSKAQYPLSIPATFGNPITVDGVLNEDLWERTEPITGFLQSEPVEGAPSSRNTEVRVLFGENSVYIGAVMYDYHENIEKSLGRRNEYNRADWFLVSIDSYFNRRTAFTFGVSAAGVQIDGQRSGSFRSAPGSNRPPGLDVSWDAIWHSAVKITDEGWVAEISIPYSMLRFPQSENQTWGFHFTRRIAGRGEISEWPLIPRSERNNLVAHYAHVTNITGISPRRNIQITPYILSGLDVRESNTTPFQPVHQTNFYAGGDIKIGLGSNVVLDATINPDFGQVEADPAELNLTAFETFYPEKRPFFLEGMEIFNFSMGMRSSLFYSRRIGAHNPIIGSAKLSGRTAGGLSFGVLGASTGNSFDPSINYGIARVSQQIGAFSSIGGIITGYDDMNPVNNRPDNSIAGGTDFDFRTRNNSYGVSGMAAFTRRDLYNAQTGPETGFAGTIELNKRQGNINGAVSMSVLSDKFNPNEIGQLMRNNYYDAAGRLNYEIKSGQEFGPFQRASARIFFYKRYSWDEGMNLGDMTNISSEWTTLGFQSLRISSMISNIFNGYDLYETRGLGPWSSPLSASISIRYTTDQRKNWHLTPDMEYEIDGNNGQSYGYGLRGIWNIGGMLSFSGNISIETENSLTAWAYNETFWVINNIWHTGISPIHPDLLADGDYIPFNDGGKLENILAGVKPHEPDKYYIPVFGERDTRSFDFTLRSSVSFTPNISLQLYSQLFLAKGRYENFKILVNPDELIPFDYYPRQSEFIYRNVLSNMVLRWEYRPGSTIYLVWSHGRSQRDRYNPLAPYGDSTWSRSTRQMVSEAFDIFPDNTIMLKLNYTFI